MTPENFKYQAERVHRHLSGLSDKAQKALIADALCEQYLSALDATGALK